MARKKTATGVNAENDILDAAYKLLSEVGYANVSTREIANAAGVALSQLNYYFKTKDNLYRKIIGDAVHRIIEELKGVFDESNTRRENFSRMIDYCKDKITEEPSLMKLLLDFTVQAMWNKGIRIYIYGLFRELNVLVQKYVIKDNRDQTTFKGVPVDYVAEIAIYGVFGMTLHVILGKRDAYEIKTEELTRMLFDESEPLAVKKRET